MPLSSLKPGMERRCCRKDLDYILCLHPDGLQDSMSMAIHLFGQQRNLGIHCCLHLVSCSLLLLHCSIVLQGILPHHKYSCLSNGKHCLRSFLQRNYFARSLLRRFDSILRLNVLFVLRSQGLRSLLIHRSHCLFRQSTSIYPQPAPANLSSIYYYYFR